MELGPYTLGYNDVNQGIYTGDSRILCEEIPNESVDLIFTDPIYQNVDDYRWLGETAKRILKSNGHLLVYVSQEHLPKQLDAINASDLQWGWLFGIQLFGRRAAVWQKKIQACGQMIAWYARSNFQHPEWADDFIGVNAKLPKGHQWRKGVEESIHYIDAFCSINGITLDPFCGGGTIPSCCVMLNRNYLAFEIQPDVAKQARERVTQTPIPLPNITPTQPNLL